MAMTQMQIIQSLGEAMSWFERELQWGVPPTELRHLSGRIGELYAALITNGQMASNVNQSGYDVVTSIGERVSVKTTAMMGSTGHVSFNLNTMEHVDRIIILRINTEEMQIEILLNDSLEQATQLMSETASKSRATISLSKLMPKPKDRSEIPLSKKVRFEQYEISELENGSIEITENGELRTPAMSYLRKIATHLGIGLINSNGNLYNTRQLGTLLIRAIESGRSVDG